MAAWATMLKVMASWNLVWEVGSFSRECLCNANALQSIAETV